MGKIIRRAVAVLLCATAVILAVLPEGDAEAVSTHGDYEYDGATVARYLGNDSEVTLPAWVNRVGKEAFEGYDKMTKLVIPDTVTTVDFGAFSNCRNLATVQMSKSVRTLGSSAFSGCTSLYSVSVPEKVRTIGSGVFAGCPSLSDVDVSPLNENYTSYDGVIYTSDGKKLVQYLAGRPSTTFQMPTSVREIEEFAFWGANNLSKLSITSGVKAIPEYAFSNCRGLQHVTLPRSVQSIFAYAFENCDSLSYINIPDSVGYIDNRAFANTKGAKLRFIDADGNVVKSFNSEDVESYGSGTSGGTVISRPEYDASVIEDDASNSSGDNADSSSDGGSNGTEEFDPTKVTPLDEGDVSDVSYSSAYDPDAADSSSQGAQSGSDGTSAGDGYSSGELYNDGYYKASDSGTKPWDTQIEYHDYEDNMTDYDLGGGVVLGGTTVLRMSSAVKVRGFDFDNAEYEDYYGESAATTPEKTDSDIIGDIYASYSGDSADVSVPAGVKAIGNRAFYKNGNLNSVSLPSGVTDIGEFAFARSALSDIKLPEGMKRIDYAAFYNCPNLTDPNIPSSVSYIALGAFDGTPYLEQWKRADTPDDFLIVGDGVLLSYKGRDKEVTVPEGVKHIAAGAFADKKNIEKAVIPGTVEDIGEEAFSSCSNLKELIIEEGIKNIYDRAFKNSALPVVSIPDSVESVGLSAFDNGGVLKSVIFNGDNVPNITYNKSATRLSAKDLRTDAFEGAENAIVSNRCNIDDGTMFNPQFYGFDGEVYTISDDDDHMLVLERAISKPDALGNV
ncbi:MAG: leucine-rich repeat protein, partial [Lachnospiraceae bacterium]|nr:leucine-rich repeat protein [Lachnospiraceae bacterium]